MFYIAFLLGLLGSFHCLGMCCPLTLLIPFDKDNEMKKKVQVFLYFLGKTCTYVFLGLLFSLIGRGLLIYEYQQFFSIFCGFTIFFIGLLSIFGKKSYYFETIFIRSVTIIKKKLTFYLKKRSFFSIFMIGFTNGLLPCGLVYTALFSALTTSGMLESVLYMLFFGIGTIPLMYAFLVAGDFLTFSLRQKIQKVIPYFILFLSIFLIIRGLGLGIPYLSPADKNLLLKGEADCAFLMGSENPLIYSFDMSILFF